MLFSKAVFHHDVREFWFAAEKIIEQVTPTYITRD